MVAMLESRCAFWVADDFRCRARNQEAPPRVSGRSRVLQLFPAFFLPVGQGSGIKCTL